MPSYHEDMKCGACNGPLEDDRTAICHTCAPEQLWFDMVEAAQRLTEDRE